MVAKNGAIVFAPIFETWHTSISFHAEYVYVFISVTIKSGITTAEVHNPVFLLGKSSGANAFD